MSDSLQINILSLLSSGSSFMDGLQKFTKIYLSYQIMASTIEMSCQMNSLDQGSDAIDFLELTSGCPKKLGPICVANLEEPKTQLSRFLHSCIGQAST